MKACEIKKWLSAFLKDEEGASGIEYALLAAMVAIVLATFVTSIKPKIHDIFSTIQDSLTNTSAGSGG